MTTEHSRIALDPAVLAGKPAEYVLLRMPMPNPGDIGPRLSNLVMSRDDWAGHFSVIEPGRIRMRRLGWHADPFSGQGNSHHPLQSGQHNQQQSGEIDHVACRKSASSCA